MATPEDNLYASLGHALWCLDLAKKIVPVGSPNDVLQDQVVKLIAMSDRDLDNLVLKVEVSTHGYLDTKS